MSFSKENGVYMKEDQCKDQTDQTTGGGPGSARPRDDGHTGECGASAAFHPEGMEGRHVSSGTLKPKIIHWSEVLKKEKHSGYVIRGRISRSASKSPSEASFGSADLGPEFEKSLQEARVPERSGGMQGGQRPPWMGMSRDIRQYKSASFSSRKKRKKKKRSGKKRNRLTSRKAVLQCFPALKNEGRSLAYSAPGIRNPSLPHEHKGGRPPRDYIIKTWTAWARKTVRNGGWFATFTFEYDVSEEAAVSMFRRFAKRLAQSLKDKTGIQMLRWVLALEWTSEGRVHLHVILNSPGLETLPRKRWMKIWERMSRACGWSRIYPATRKAIPYSVKYAGKGGLLEFGGALPGCRRRYREASTPQSFPARDAVVPSG